MGVLTIRHLPAVTNIRFLSIVHFSSIHDDQRFRPFRVMNMSLSSRLSIEVCEGVKCLTAANSRCVVRWLRYIEKKHGTRAVSNGQIRVPGDRG